MPFHRIRRATVALAVTMLAAAATAAPPAPTLYDAHRAYYLGDYARSLAIYERHASAGNAEAAERAGFMLLHGEGLYGKRVRRDIGRALVLLNEAAAAGRAGASFMLQMVDLAD